MATKKMICIVCPIGCQLEVAVDEQSGSYFINGNKCKRGEEYGIKEMTSPTRVLTATIKLKDSRLKRLPVRTDGAIPKGLIKECMKLLRKTEASAPVKTGEIIIENILETGVNIISSRSVN